MSREIKFRAWDKINKKLRKVIMLDFDNDLFDVQLLTPTEIAPKHWCLRKFSDIELMQFTGLKDKNGKDIYEGDILLFHYFYGTLGEGMGFVEAEHELTGIVKWLNFGFGLDAIKGEHWNGYTGYSDGEGCANFLDLASMNESAIHEESFEIIGNIYEHPELISK